MHVDNDLPYNNPIGERVDIYFRQAQGLYDMTIDDDELEEASSAIKLPPIVKNINN